MDLTRLRAGEWLAAAGGIALIVALLLPWYQPLLPIVPYDSLTGFQALSVIDVLLTPAGLLGVVLAVLQVTQDSPSRPVAAGVLTVVVGLLATLLVLFRIVVVPRPDDELELMAGAWLALVAALALTGGGWLSIRTEHVPGLPPGPEPELRQAPRIAADAEP